MSNHFRDDHKIEGAPIDRMRGLIARHLCGWITGHNAPLAHFLVDADLILNEAETLGITFGSKIADAIQPGYAEALGLHEDQ